MLSSETVAKVYKTANLLKTIQIEKRFERNIRTIYSFPFSFHPIQSLRSHKPTFSNRSGLGIGNLCRLASCSKVRSMFLSFRRTYLYQIQSHNAILQLFLTSKLKPPKVLKSFGNLTQGSIRKSRPPGCAPCEVWGSVIKAPATIIHPTGKGGNIY